MLTALIVLGVICLIAAFVMYTRSRQIATPNPNTDHPGHHTCRIPGQIEVTFEIPEVHVTGTGRFNPAQQNAPMNSWWQMWLLLGCGFLAIGLLALALGTTNFGNLLPAGHMQNPNAIDIPRPGAHVYPNQEYPNGSTMRHDDSRKSDQSSTAVDNSDHSVTNTSVTEIKTADSAAMNQVQSMIDSAKSNIIAEIQAVNKNLNEHRAGARASHAQAVEQRSEIQLQVEETQAQIDDVASQITLARAEISQARQALYEALAGKDRNKIDSELQNLKLRIEGLERLEQTHGRKHK